MNEDEKTTVNIPESITINGVTYTVKDTPELQTLIKTAAKIEKNKLYSQFETLKSQISALGKTPIIPDSPMGNIETIVEKLRSTFVTKEDLKNELPNVLKEVVQPVLAATEQSRINELAQFKEKLLKDNEGSCFPEMVEGATKEELIASLERSKNLRAKYANVIGQPEVRVTDPALARQAPALLNPESTNNTPTPPPASPAPATPAVPPVTPRRPSPDADNTPQNIKAMTESEFSSKREQLLETLKNTYGG